MVDQKDEAIKRQARRKLRKRLRKEAFKEIQPIALGSLAMVASTLCNQAVPRLLGKLLDQNKTSGSTARASSISQSTLSSLAVVVLGGGVASFLRTTMLNRAEDSIACRLRRQAFASLLMNRELEWFQAESIITPSSSDEPNDKTTNDDTVVPTGMTPGAIASIMNEDVDTVAKSVTINLASLLRSSCSCVFGTYHMLRLSPGLFGMSFGIVPLIGTAAMILRRFIKKVSTKQRETATLAASFCEERLTHIAMVKMSNRELDEVENFDKLQQECVRLGQGVSVANGAFMGFIFAASSGALFLVFNAGGKAVAAGRMTPGDLTSFATYSFLLGLGTSGIFKALGDIAKGMVSAERVYRLVGEDDAVKQPEVSVVESKKKQTLDASKVNSISLNNVHFAYKSNPETMVLKDISMQLERGKVTALVGKNGSGKSTIASLLAALYKPNSGNISLSNGTDYVSLDRKVQKTLVQIVPQVPALFNTTILENVRYSNPNVSIEDAQKALILANCDGFVSKLQDGIHHQVGPNGCKLSGGQRQRLGLARALLSDPLLLVMDEPTSSLDFEGETAVADAMSASHDRALLLISHRTKSLELADNIIVLKQGEIVERGGFEELRSKRDSVLCSLMPDLLL